MGPDPRLRANLFEKWSADDFDEGELGLENWAADEEPLVDLAGFGRVPVDAFDDTPDEEAPDWSQRVRLTPRQFVQKEATEIALHLGWGEAGKDVIAYAISPYRAFGKVRSELLRFIRGKRVNIRELRLVTELRGAWLEGGYSRGWVYMRNRFGSRPVDCKINLDWWLGLRLLRALRTDDVDEVRLFLDDCFEEWTAMRSACVDVDLSLMDHKSPELGATMHFHRYLHLILQRMISNADWRRMPTFVDYRLFPREEGIRDCSADYMDPLSELSFHD